MAGNTADCPCGAVVHDPEVHAEWHRNLSAWVVALTNPATTPAPRSGNRPGWPHHLTVWTLPPRPAPDPVTQPTVEPEAP